MNFSDSLKVIDSRGHDHERVDEMMDFHSAGVVVGGGPIATAMWVSTVMCCKRGSAGRPAGKARESWKARASVTRKRKHDGVIPRQLWTNFLAVACV